MKVIVGPCVLEDDKITDHIARCVVELQEKLDIEIIFKASFDKANRTSVHSYRGPGIADGVKTFLWIKEKYGLKITTDIHEPHQAPMLRDAVDIIQIPAFLCRQTDLLKAAGGTHKIVNVKKGQFLHPQQMVYSSEKLAIAGAEETWITERGTCFGYNSLVNDMSAIVEMKGYCHKVIFDGTHSVQQPGGVTTGGNRERVLPLCLAAIAAGADGVFLETHPDPDNALSDGPNMVPLGQLEYYVTRMLGLYNYVNVYGR